MNICNCDEWEKCAEYAFQAGSSGRLMMIYCPWCNAKLYAEKKESALDRWLLWCRENLDLIIDSKELLCYEAYVEIKERIEKLEKVAKGGW